MKLKIYDEPEAFLERIRPILEKQEAANSLMLGLLTAAAETPGFFGGLPYMGLLEDGDEALLIAFKTPRAKLILFSEEANSIPQNGFELLAADFAAKGVEMAGVLGPTALTTRFSEAWVALKGGSYRVAMGEGVYELTKVVPPRLVPGRFRPAQPKNSELLAQWVVAFEKEALGIQATAEGVIGQVQRRIELGNLFVWEDAEGQVVAMAGRSRPTRHGTTVNAVYTPPELRGKGYASNCVAALSQYILDSGKTFAALFTDLANPTSNAIYQKMGYRHILNYDDVAFEA